MLEIATDRRRIEADPDERAHEEAVLLGRRYLEVKVALARTLRRIDATKTWAVHACASIEEYGVRLGIDTRDARQLVELGQALDCAATPSLARLVVERRAEDDAVAATDDAPSVVGIASDGAVGTGSAVAPASLEDAAPASATVADAVLAGVLSLDRAAAAGRFAATPELIRDGEDPVALATSGSLRQVRALLREREEELAQEEEVVQIGLAVTARALDGFRRARSIASEQAGTMLTEGETFAVVVEHYLESFDSVRRGEGARRVPDTRERPGDRYIPASERRAVRLRSGDRCEVPGCTHCTFLEFAHDEAHREGGSRERRNLFHACGPHHVLFDAGRIRTCAWTADGRPVFCDRRGRLLADHRTLGDAPGRAGTDDVQLAERPPPYGRTG